MAHRHGWRELERPGELRYRPQRGAAARSHTLPERHEHGLDQARPRGVELSRRDGFHSRGPEGNGADGIRIGLRVYGPGGLLAQFLVGSPIEGRCRLCGVTSFVWYIRSAIQDPKILEQNLELCNRVGIAGLKIDFFDHEHKEVIDLYEMFAKAAAQHKLMVDFHGCNKPTGMERTYPNIVGMEGVRGMEFFPPYAQHDVVLPFTR